MKKILGAFALATMLAVPVMAFAADNLPAGIIAASNTMMDFTRAEAFCRKNGGRLPRIGGKYRLKYHDVSKGTRIPGFGAVGAPWPTGLREGVYWTNTMQEDSKLNGFALDIFSSKGRISVVPGHRTRKHHAVCVQ